MDPSERRFDVEREKYINAAGNDLSLVGIGRKFLEESAVYKYTYNFDWLGRPIIQLPQDMVAIQELIWALKPDLIVETGIAHGGSIMLSASMLALLDYCDAAENEKPLSPGASTRRVVAVDIDIRSQNRSAIEKHPLSHLIHMIEGSSIDNDVIEHVRKLSEGFQSVLVLLDSNHTHDHVLAELEAYAPLVTPGSYCVVFDTVIEELQESMYPDRPWGKTDNPKTAVWEFLRKNPAFEVDLSIEHKLLMTVAPQGYLKRS